MAQADAGGAGTSRVLAIGLDGATWTTLEPRLRRGDLPHLRALVDAGAHGVLRSILPPLSGPAWATILTGMHPGRHGIFDFTWKPRGATAGRLVDGRDIDGPTLPDLLSWHGVPSILVNVMMTYPPRPLLGCTITGGLTPPGADCFTSPPELARDLEAALGEPYPLSTRGGLALGSDRPGLLLDLLLGRHAARCRAFEHLLDTRPWRFAMILMEESDIGQHAYWHYEDPAHPRHTGSALPDGRRPLDEIYRALDRAIGRLLSRLDPARDHVLVVSDHGFRGQHAKLMVNNLLRHWGMLRFRSTPGALARRAAAASPVSPARLYRLLRRFGADRLKRAMTESDAGRRRLGRWLLSLDDVDWTRTTAYSEGVGGGVYLNLAGREPHGTVRPGPEADRLLDQIASRLAELTDPTTGVPLAPVIRRGRDLYPGPHQERAPDLVFWPARAATPLEQSAFVTNRVFERAADSGGHDPAGVYVLGGPGVRAGAGPQLDLVDFAAIALHLLREPGHDGLDGHVPPALFDAGAGTALDRVPMPPPFSTAAREVSAAEKAQVQERLRDLGYFG